MTDWKTKTAGYDRTFNAWRNLRRRCFDPNHREFANYGGRGISVCDRWVESYENFLADMGEAPVGHSIDRFPNNNGNYEPGNCRWALQLDQMRNTRRTKLTPDIVNEILGRLEHGEGVRSIRRRLGISQPIQIRAIRDGRTWVGVAPKFAGSPKEVRPLGPWGRRNRVRLETV